MTDATTKRMLSAYRPLAGAPMFLSGWFQSPPQNFHRSEKVEIDVERDEPNVALPVQDLDTGFRHNKNTKFTNKEWTPPVFNEAAIVKGWDTLKREPGEIPYSDGEFIGRARARALRSLPKLERKIRRAIELMASQVLQTGKISIKDSTGALYEEDFEAKDTHFPNAATTWGDSGADPLNDLQGLAQKIRRHGKTRPRVLIFGETAFGKFIDDATVQKRLDNRNMKLGEVAPEVRGAGATFQGFVWIGHYRFEMWTYDGFYIDPETNTDKSFVDDNNVIMLSRAAPPDDAAARFDLTFGEMPLLKLPSDAARRFLPPATRLMDGERSLDLQLNAWFSGDGRNLHVSAGTRALTIPTAVDAFGCLNTQAA